MSRSLIRWNAALSLSVLPVPCFSNDAIASFMFPIAFRTEAGLISKVRVSWFIRDIYCRMVLNKSVPSMLLMQRFEIFRALSFSDFRHSAPCFERQWLTLFGGRHLPPCLF